MQDCSFHCEVRDCSLHCKFGPAVGSGFFQLRMHSGISCLRSLSAGVYFENCITKPYQVRLPSFYCSAVVEESESQGVGGFWVEWIPRNTRSRTRIFYPTPEVQLNYFLHRTSKLGILTRACWNDTISFETLIEAENSCCVPRFPLISSC